MPRAMTPKLMDKIRLNHEIAVRDCPIRKKCWRQLAQAVDLLYKHVMPKGIEEFNKKNPGFLTMSDHLTIASYKGDYNRSLPMTRKRLVVATHIGGFYLPIPDDILNKLGDENSPAGKIYRRVKEMDDALTSSATTMNSKDARRGYSQGSLTGRERSELAFLLSRVNTVEEFVAAYPEGAEFVPTESVEDEETHLPAVPHDGMRDLLKSLK